MRSNKTLSTGLRRLAAIICGTSFFSPSSPAELIPANRLTSWQPGVTVGVPGGIPIRTNLINVTAPPYSADRTGASDATSAIQSALNAANTNDVIFLPAGIYRLTSSLHPKNNTTIRGEGMDVTTLKFFGPDGGISSRHSSNGFWSPTGYGTVATGATKGSTVLTTSDTSTFVVGNMIQVVRFNTVSQFASPLVVNVQGSEGGNGWMYKQKTRLVSKTPTTLTVFPPIYGDMSGAEVKTLPGTSFLGGVGIENLTVDMSNSLAQVGIMLEEHIGSWIKGVRIKGVQNFTVHIMDCLFVEVRDSFLDELNNTGPNGAGLLVDGTSASLFENNIILNSFPSMEINAGSCGNVFGYNFAYNSTGFFSIDTNHAAHNSYNLYEGNVANNLIADGHYGSVDRDTVFRNWLHGINHWYALRLNRFTRDYSVVGNIFGSNNDVWQNDGVNLGEPGIGSGAFSGTAPPWADWGTGPGPGGFQELDLGVKATLVRKGNYNHFNKAIPDAESLGGDSLPNSLYLSGKPAWFGNLTWPPVNPMAPGSPTKNELFATIPAGYRYVNGTNPSGTSASPPIATPTPSATPTSSPTPPAMPTPSPTPAPSPTPPSLGGLVAAIGFDEASGTSASDSSGNGNTGIITGTSRVSGKFGNALSFNGTSDFVRINASASLNLSSAMTLEAWVYPTANQSGWRTIIQREVVAYWLHAGHDSGVLRPATGGTFSGAESWFSATAGIPVNTWTHLASTYDGATLRLYVNGALVASRAVTGNIQTNSNPLWIGGNGPFGEYFQGRIDEVRIYNTALTQTQVQADMNLAVSSTAAEPSPPSNLIITSP